MCHGCSELKLLNFFKISPVAYEIKDGFAYKKNHFSLDFVLYIALSVDECQKLSKYSGIRILILENRGNGRNTAGHLFYF